jgi:hypothetical protein
MAKCTVRKLDKPPATQRGNRPMGNPEPLKFCSHGQHAKPRAEFRTLPGVAGKREVCADCYRKIMAVRKRMNVIKGQG